jgi:hypothetical protein
MDSVSGQSSDVESGIDPGLGHVASALAGLGVQVWCWSSEDWKERTSEIARRYTMERLGPWRAYADVRSSAIHLSPEVCAELRSLAEPDAPITGDAPRDARAWSVFSLGHEAYHVSGVLDEAEATCFGMQSIENAARLLGRTAAEGRHLATLYWKHWYGELDSSHRSVGCRNGGELDMRPETDVWP